MISSTLKQDGIAFACPACRSENTQRMSMVWLGGTAHAVTETAGMGVALAGDDLIPVLTSSGSVGTHQSELARLCAPPAKAAVGDWIKWGWLLWAPLAGTLVAVAYVLLHTDREAAWWSNGQLLAAGTASGALGLWGAVYGRSRVQAARRYNQTTWRRAAERWEQTWVCLRCGHRHIPT